VTRALPGATDFVLQTEFEPMTREFGNWQAGLWMQVQEGGQPVTYVFSLDGGTALNVRRGVAPNPFTFIGTVSGYAGSGASLRVVRSGGTLVFQRKNGLVWTTVNTQALPAGSVALRGGIFTSTSVATNSRTGFSYLLVSDTAAANPVLAGLRVTEVHYNPVPGGVEFIELRNTGNQSVSLSGVTFDAGAPFAMAGTPVTPYTFGAESLAPGEFIVIPENAAEFQAMYGAGIRLAPAWTSGGLSNGGERVVLMDGSANVIHDFSYDDAAPWPLAADGTGPSLEVISLELLLILTRQSGSVAGWAF
jgi:hypothetical protein